MRYLFFLLFPVVLGAQTNTFDEIAFLEDNEHILIDITTGGCMHSESKLTIIRKKEAFYEYSYLENIHEIIIKIDEKLLLYRDKLKKWIQNNTEKLAAYGARSMLTEKQHQRKMASLEKAIEVYKNCSSTVEGNYSTIEIDSDRVHVRKNFNCKIAFDLKN
jgi:uncharacterized protein YneR